MDKVFNGPVAEVTQALRLNWLVDADRAHGMQGKQLFLSAPPALHVGVPEGLREALVDSIVKHCVDKDVRGGMAEAWARHAVDEVLRPGASAADRVEGDVLPALGARVWIRHGRDDDAHACLVVGYYAWPALTKEKYSHRVFVRLVYEGTTTPNARHVSECWATKELALANDRAEGDPAG